MYCDLGLSYSDSEASLHRERICTSLSLGYNTVASATAIAERLTSSSKCSTIQLDDASIASGGVQLHRILKLGGSFKPGTEGHVVLKQLTRLNFIASDPAQAQQLATNQQIVRTYDLVCVVPRSERVLQQACSSLDVDIIALELHQRLPFKLKPALLKPALARGVHFEVCYAPALREPSARRHLFANAQALVRATRGRNIILSSGARLASELRGPADVINLASLFGMSLKSAKEAVSSRPGQVIERATSRRQFHKGAVRLLEPAAQAAGHSGAAAAAAPRPASAGRQRQQQQQQQSQQAAGGSHPMDVDRGAGQRVSGGGGKQRGGGAGGRGQQRAGSAADQGASGGAAGPAVGSKRKSLFG